MLCIQLKSQANSLIMGIKRTSECRVDLDSARVALEGTRDVVHLLQRVAHVGVGVGEGRLDPGSEVEWHFKDVLNFVVVIKIYFRADRYSRQLNISRDSISKKVPENQ